jgi:hypothetical protein
MKTIKLNFTVPEDIATELKSRVSSSKRSAFVTAAVAARLKELEEEQLRQSLVEGYRARQAEDAEINRDWEGATQEKWPG